MIGAMDDQEVQEEIAGETEYQQFLRLKTSLNYIIENF